MSQQYVNKNPRKQDACLKCNIPIEKQWNNGTGHYDLWVPNHDIKHEHYVANEILILRAIEEAKKSSSSTIAPIINQEQKTLTYEERAAIKEKKIDEMAAKRDKITNDLIVAINKLTEKIDEAIKSNVGVKDEIKKGFDGLDIVLETVARNSNREPSHDIGI